MRFLEDRLQLIGNLIRFRAPEELVEVMEEVVLATSAAKREETWVDRIPQPIRELLSECVSNKIASLQYSEGWALTLKGDAKYEKHRQLRAKGDVLRELKRLLDGGDVA